MESLLCEKWELQPKHSSTEVLQRWRDLCGVVKNPKRRFRFTANISKRHEAAEMRKTNQVVVGMASCTSETCGANSYELQLHQTNQEELVVTASLLDNGASWNNDQELNGIVNNYCTNSIEIVGEFSAALQQLLKAINEHRSLVHGADLCRHMNGEQVINFLKSFHDLLMQERSALHSLNSSLAEKADCIGVWKNVCDVLFTATTAFSAAAAAANANSNRKVAAAAASAASILSGAIGKWIHSALKKRESAVKERKDTIGVMIRGAGNSIDYLTSVIVLSGRLHGEANSVLQMVADRAMEVDVRNKVAELNNIFQELRGKANDYGQNMNRVTEAVLQNTITLSV